MADPTRSSESAKRWLFAIAALMSLVFMVLAFNGLLSLIAFLHEPDRLPSTLTLRSGQTFPFNDRLFVAVNVLAIAIFAILPTCWIVNSIRRYRASRLPQHICKTCGYDIRASKDRCSECGGAIPH